MRRCRSLQAGVQPCGSSGVGQAKRSHRTCGSDCIQQRGVQQHARRPVPPTIPPVITIGNPRDGKRMDLMGYLSRQRIVYIGDRITDTVATSVCAKLLALEAIDPDAEIQIYINSSGGIPYSVFAIMDTMNIVKCPIRTVALGCVMSQSILILANGTKGRRFGMKNARLMMHQPQGGVQGVLHDAKVQVAELNRLWRTIQAMLADLTGLPLEEVEVKTDRDTYMSTQDAVEIGLVDGVIE